MAKSGARSGTRPKRYPSAGDGRIGATKLACGHETHGDPLLTGAVTKWSCPEGCGLQVQVRG